MEHTIYRFDVPQINNCKLNHTDNVVELRLSDGSTAIIKILVSITDNMRRQVVISSNQKNVGFVMGDYGDLIDKSKSFITRMLNTGFVIDDEDKHRLCNVLKNICKSRSLDHYTHSTKGIIPVNGIDYIVGERIFSETDAPFRDSVYKHKSDTKMEFSEPELLIKGNYELLRKGLNELVLGRELILELAYIIGASGIVNRVIKGNNVQNIIISIAGKPHTGKNTVYLLPASIWTIPENLTTEIATEAGLRRFISDGNTLPLIGNDITVRSKQLNETVSAFADGRGLLMHHSTATRHNKPLLLSSNTSLVDVANRGNNSGFASRIFEICLDNYTDSAEHAEAIVRFVSDCYGIAGEMFLEYLASFGDVESIISTIYETYLNQVRTSHPEVNGRQQQKIALILVTGQLLGEALGVEFRLADIRQLLVDCVITGITQSDQAALDVVREINELYNDKTGKLFFYHNTVDGYDPDLHVAIVCDDILYCSGKSLTSCSFARRSNGKVKRQLVDMGILIVGEHNGIAVPRDGTYTFRINGIKDMLYAFKLKTHETS